MDTEEVTSLKISTTWGNLIQKSESYSKLSKPEILAVIDILKDYEELPLQELHDIFIKNYKPDLNPRQLRYILTTMEENELIIKNTDGYSLNGTDITPYKPPISMYEAVLLTISLIPLFLTWSMLAFGLFVGILISIVLHQIEHAFSVRKKPKIDKILEKTISNQ